MFDWPSYIINIRFSLHTLSSMCANKSPGLIFISITHRNNIFLQMFVLIIEYAEHTNDPEKWSYQEDKGHIQTV